MRLRPVDLIRLAVSPIQTKKVRVALSATGVAVGIAAMVAVLGISESSRADLLAQLDRLGTNLLTVSPGRGSGDAQATLPNTAPAMIARVRHVQGASAIGALATTVRRNAYIPAVDTAAVSVAAAQPALLDTLNGAVASGSFLDHVTENYPTVVLGADAATQLGIDHTDGQAQLYLNSKWFTVIGILRHITLAPELDRAALIGFPEARTLTATAVPPTTVYVRANPDDVPSVQQLLAPSANPAHPNTIEISRPSDALAARAAATSTFTGLFFGLGALTLLVGGLGCANVMVIAVLERRHEIGLRRALGASRTHIGTQFIAESLVLSLLGGAAGILTGIAATTMWAHYRDWTTDIPATAVIAGLTAALLVGTVAGIYPALRAAHLSPTDALRAS